MIYYCIFSLMFMLGVMVTPGSNLRWYDVVLAPLCMAYMIGRFVSVYLVRNNVMLDFEKKMAKKEEEKAK